MGRRTKRVTTTPRTGESCHMIIPRDFKFGGACPALTCWGASGQEGCESPCRRGGPQQQQRNSSALNISFSESDQVLNSIGPGHVTHGLCGLKTKRNSISGFRGGSGVNGELPFCPRCIHMCLLSAGFQAVQPICSVPGISTKRAEDFVNKTPLH